MTSVAKPACPRLFEVEALRDGRLAGPEIARFRAHARVCPVCAGEAETLEALAEALRSPTRVDADELHVRRERTRLLAAFDASLVPALRRDHSRFWFSAAALIVLSSALALGFVFTRSRPDSASRTATAPVARAPESVLIHAESSARWSRRIEQHFERIVLESGSLSIRVDRGRTALRVLVVLPDGELEDIGTTFSVSAAGAHTTRVTVQEGSVVLRLHGARPIVLGAGDSWPATTAPSTAPSTARAAPPPSDGTTQRAPATAMPAPVPSARPPDPSADFRTALSALNGGNNSGAAALFARFLADHPSDPRIEDAAYLRVLALHRSGNQSATERAAGEYLRRFPRGFRRTEVEGLKPSSP